MVTFTIKCMKIIEKMERDIDEMKVSVHTLEMKDAGAVSVSSTDNRALLDKIPVKTVEELMHLEADLNEHEAFVTLLVVNKQMLQKIRLIINQYSPGQVKSNKLQTFFVMLI